MRILRLPILSLAILSGCMLGESGIRRGTPITHTQADFGIPDVISDQSGDETRDYLPTNRPAEEWPADAPRTFYYLDRDIAVTFVSGKAVRARPMTDQENEAVSELLIRQKRK